MGRQRRQDCRGHVLPGAGGAALRGHQRHRLLSEGPGLQHHGDRGEPAPDAGHPPGKRHHRHPERARRGAAQGQRHHPADEHEAPRHRHGRGGRVHHRPQALRVELEHQEEAEELQRAEDDPERQARGLRHRQDRVVREAFLGLLPPQGPPGPCGLRDALPQHGQEGLPSPALGPPGPLVPPAAAPGAPRRGGEGQLAGDPADADAAPRHRAPLRAGDQGPDRHRGVQPALHAEALRRGRPASAQDPRRGGPAPWALRPGRSPGPRAHRGLTPGRPPRHPPLEAPGELHAHHLPHRGRHGAGHRPAVARLGLPRGRRHPRGPLGRPEGLAESLGPEVLLRPAGPRGGAGA
mmetsp:Transcript_12458/g.39290  ORF Transcript_12458/g.39290 Transcript_12458/m.39290 type:complete len:350 (+) Transcript_12458:337-1386(+)